jgi:ATP-dependent DNA helicase RecG
MTLDEPVSALPGVGPKYVEKLNKLGIKTVEDLLLHIPSRHIDFSNKSSISELSIGDETTIVGQVVSIENVYTKTGKLFQIAKISDGENTVDAVWMRQPYLVRNLPVGTVVSLSGKLSFFGRKRAFMFPQYEKYSGENLHTGRLVPVYSETEGVSSKWLRRLVNTSLKDVEIDDFLDEEIVSTFKMLTYKKALETIHRAKDKDEFESGYGRLAFNEMLLLQIENTFKKNWWQINCKSHSLKSKKGNINKFLKGLPFELTESQSEALESILLDLEKDVPMNRLLEGDVGSGKTVVAAAGAYTAFLNSKKSVLMAPTQILAEQHAKTVSDILSDFGMNLALVTADTKTDNLEEADMLIGTHALLFREDLVKDAAFLVIDEQHRFGVNQRAKIAELAKSGKVNPHILTMTATPIPRTIALTIYGDLDVSSLKELPMGRKKVKTWVIPPKKRKAAEKWIEEEIRKESIQAFVVCPLIEDSDAEGFSQVKSVTEEYKRLLKTFPRLKIALLHGRMKAKEKNEILKDFKDKKYDILVSTPVIEVGIDIPNANIMIIEAAERFGLAQLHQLRGRVGRGKKDAYCLLFTESKSDKVKARLDAVSKAKSGKELAELDLENRGPGEILGIRQHGIAELRIARWNDLELIEKARRTADTIVKNQEKHEKVLAYYKKKQPAPN